MNSRLRPSLSLVSGLCVVFVAGLLVIACSSRQIQTGSREGDNANADAGPPLANAQELCDHYAACASSAGPIDGGTDSATPGFGDAATAANGDACNLAREAIFQSKPAAHCGCRYANECPGSTCDVTTGECADSPRVVCKAYCGNALFVDSCTADSCGKFCGQFLPEAKTKCRPLLDAFMNCAKAEALPNYRCASYILAPSFPVPLACDAQYKAVADCVY